MVGTDQLSGQRVLVTGASGFIGSFLCRRLRSHGAEVHGTSRRMRPTNENCSQWWQNDLTDIKVLRGILNKVKPDLIFHLAGHAVGARSLELVAPTFRNNLISTVNLLTAATEIGCKRIILTGSLEEPEPCSTWSVASSPYAAAKLASSAYGRMFHALYESPVVILRLFMVYGPGQKDLRKLIPYVTLSLLQGRPPELSSGLRKVDWIYVDDVVDGYITAAQAQDVDGCTIDLGSGQLVSVRAVVEYLVELVSSDVKPVFGALPDRALEQERTANLSDTYARIGWKPRVTLEQGLKLSVEWYKTSKRGDSVIG